MAALLSSVAAVGGTPLLAPRSRTAPRTSSRRSGVVRTNAFWKKKPPAEEEPQQRRGMAHPVFNSSTSLEAPVGATLVRVVYLRTRVASSYPASHGPLAVCS